MKIHELLESAPIQARVSSGRYSINLSLEHVPGELLKRNLKKAISILHPNARCYFDKEELSVVIGDIQQAHLHELEDLYNNVVDTVEDTVENEYYSPDQSEAIAFGTAQLIFNGVPSFQVDNENIIIICQDDTYGLTGLDKVIGPNVEHLQVIHIHRLKGNILSLCNLKCRDVEIDGSTEDTRTIMKIYDDLPTPKRVLPFQRALMAAKLLEFAKL
jgi:hypothetical protein